MSSLSYELRKIPPVTRFLCISSVAITAAAILQIAPVSIIAFHRDLAVKKFQVWRFYTSFFLNLTNIYYIFEFAMLYLNSDALESANFPGQSPDYAWGLSMACIAILTLNLPLHSPFHGRAMLHCITYLRCQLAPSGDQTSIWGLFNVPTVYFPFAFLFIELLMGGAEGLMRGLTGVAVGHMWFWGVYQSRALLNASKAPAWVNYVVARGPLPSLGGTGVHVITPRAKPQPKKGPTTWTGGHKWGSGNKLGGEKTSSASQNPWQRNVDVVEPIRELPLKFL